MSPQPHHLDHEDPPYDPDTALPPAEPYVPDDYDDRPTPKQLAYLRSLAQRTGQTFAWPKTRRQASAEINRLKHARPSTRVERRVERKLIADQIATGPIDSARVRDEEISGYGSSATWTQNRDQDPPPIEDPGVASHRRRAAVVGKRTELARYRVRGGERVVYGQRVDGIVRVTDRPSGDGGRSYLVERGLETQGELDALVADYVVTAQRLQAVPMSESPVGRYLQHLA